MTSPEPGSVSAAVSHRLVGDRGASPVSVLILFGVLLMFVELIVLGARIAGAQASVSGAAREAARMGSIAAGPSDLANQVEPVVLTHVSEQGRQCLSPQTSIDGTIFRPGGRVQVAVTCTVDIQDLSFLAIPWPKKEFTAMAVEVINTYRVVES